jgi:hypothetical protein
MADGKNTWVFDLDTKEALKKIVDFKGEVEGLGDTKAISNLISGLGKVAGAAAILGTAFFALKATVDAIFEAEDIKAINQQFEMLTSNAGLAGNAIKDGLVKAAGGLADDEELLSAANAAIVKMGDNARRLPEIMDLARKSTAVFGGDLMQNFEGLSNAIANGNQRALKQYGILIDTEKAVRNYAVSIGSTVSALSDSGRQQAILNAVIEKGQTAFDGVDVNIKKNQNTFKELVVTIGQIKEVFIVTFEKTVGPMLATTLGYVKNFANGVKESLENLNSSWGENSTVVETQIEEQKKKLSEAMMMLDNAKTQLDLDKDDKRWQKAYNTWQVRVDAIEGELMGLVARRKQLKQEAEDAEKEGASPKATPKIDIEKQRQQQAEFVKSLEQMQQTRLSLEEKNATDIETVNLLHNQRKIEIAEQFATKTQELDTQVAMGKITREQADLLLTESAAITQQRLIELDDSLEKKRLDALQRFSERNKETAVGFTAAWNVETQKAILLSNNWAARGQFAFQTFNKQAVQAFKSIGDGSKNAGEAMKSFMLGALGEIATSEGEVMLAKGIGLYDPIQIAQGGTLIALGALISSQAGGGAVSGGGGGGAGGGGGFAQPGSMDQTKPEVKEPKKSVSIQVMGSYFETEQTKTRLMEMIRESSDATDFSFKQVGQ